MRTEAEITADMKRYAQQIHESAQRGQKPGAALANYMRVLKEMDALVEPDDLKLVELRMTCSACPSQWEGKLEDGRAVYVRYRWGHLTAHAAPTIQEAITVGPSAETIVAEQVGDGLDGSMDEATMLSLTGLTRR